jgi:diaminohydroxyphosphoribosylaminopyrimidine deaminase / 5-amino-6-(5-phosphoribosylamino)uracil reductase
MSGTSQLPRPVSLSEDEAFLQEALALAARIPQRPWPNPPVGALVVQDGVVVGRGAHHGAGQAHAERLALAEAGDRARGATLYCTLEPCRHHGRTPPCTEAIIAAGIARLVAGVRDLNPPASGGAGLLRAAGLDVTVGVLAGPCLELIWPFVTSDGFARPYVELKTATSLDGRFAGPRDPAGWPAYLTCETSRRAVHVRRRWLDLVLVGAGTALLDRPRLDTRLVPDGAACPQAEPQAGCVSGRDGAHADALALNRPAWICFHPAGAAPALPEGAAAVACPAGAAGVDPAGLLQVCHERGLATILLESGPTLSASFLAAGLVDRWVQYTAPLVLGGGVTWPERFEPSAAGFHLTRCERSGDDLCAVWDRRDFAAALVAATSEGGAG